MTWLRTLLLVLAATTAAVTAAGDEADELATPPSVIGAGTDMADPSTSPTAPANGSPGGALLIGGVVVLVMVAAVILLARRGRG